MKKLIGFLILSMTVMSTISHAQRTYTSETIIGIGATLQKLHDGTIQVLALTPGAPAEKAGLMTNDVILSVKSLPSSSVVSVLNLSLADVVNLIRGPEGTTVEIQFKRGTSKEAFISILRAKFEVSEDK